MTTYERKVQAVTRGEWLLNPPVVVCTAEQAFAMIRFVTRQGKSRPCLMAVTWWGTEIEPLPAGYTRFTFADEPPAADGFAIIYHDEPRPTTGRIARDELVLMYGPNMHAYGSY